MKNTTTTTTTTTTRGTAYNIERVLGEKPRGAKWAVPVFLGAGDNVPSSVYYYATEADASNDHNRID